MKTFNRRVLHCVSLSVAVALASCGIAGPDGSLLLPERGQLNYDWDTYPVMFSK